MKPCHLCGKYELLPLLDFGEHPIAHRFLTGRWEEEYVHPVAALFCEKCGLTQLADSIPPEMLYTNSNRKLSCSDSRIGFARILGLGKPRTLMKQFGFQRCERWDVGVSLKVGQGIYGSFGGPVTYWAARFYMTYDYGVGIQYRKGHEPSAYQQACHDC